MNAITPQLYAECFDGIVQDATAGQLTELCELILANASRSRYKYSPDPNMAAAAAPELFNQPPNGRAAEQSPHGFINSQADAPATV